MGRIFGLLKSDHLKMIGVGNLSKSCTIFDILCENTRPNQLVLRLCRNARLLSAINNKISSNEIFFLIVIK